MPDVLEYLIERGLSFLVMPDPRPVGAEEAARSHGLSADELFRTEVMVCVAGPALMIVPATEYLDLELAQRALGDPGARPATHAELRALAPGCDIGAVPPLSLWLLAPMYVDPGVAERDQVVFPAERTNILICVQREELFGEDPYVVVPLTRGSAAPAAPLPPSRRAILEAADLPPVHLTEP